MKCGLILLPVLALGADVVESPVQKVVTMLKAMSEKGKAELQEEKVQYARYAQWCSSTQAEKSSAIEDAAGKLEVLSADMAKATTEAEVLSKEIEEHNSQIVRIGEEQEKAKEVRAKEAEDYTKELKDYTEAVDAISRALDTMETQALLQLGSGRAAQEVKRLVSMAKPKVASYESQTGIITAMLKNMQKQFVEEKHSLETNETSKVHSFELLMTSLQNQQGSESEDKERKAGLKAKKLSLKASKEDELSTTKSSKEADTKYLDDVSATCRQKAADYESNQKLRGQELEAIEQAVRIVSQKLSLLEVKWRGLLQVKRHGRRKATSLALLRSVKNDERIQAKLLGFLQGEAQRLRSAALTNLLQPVATEALGKVRETIEGEIERLEEQDTQDTEKQTWCSSELKSNEKTRRSKRVKVDELTADIDRLNAWVISLGEDIQNLQDELTDSAKARGRGLRSHLRGPTLEAFGGWAARTCLPLRAPRRVRHGDTPAAGVAGLGLDVASADATETGPSGSLGRPARTRRAALPNGFASEEEYLSYLKDSGVDLSEVRKDSGVGDFFAPRLPGPGGFRRP
ncbi:Uncharacterized protein SCF082_LOCUS35230 [Durusdinium trenchii]|uniref:Uncharacterized protein n=1 Tax=Durusdinium trenchii TaxID=1381693 RepID=A0ABP0P4X4_9DINO